MQEIQLINVIQLHLAISRLSEVEIQTAQVSWEAVREKQKRQKTNYLSSYLYIIICFTIKKTNYPLYHKYKLPYVDPIYET